jgi:UDP-N-acetylglucosamine transferase subunit ALG13
MLVAAVGTFVAGFDDLVAAADDTCRKFGLKGFAQIGHSTIVPQSMEWERFLQQDRLVTLFQAARLVVCHAGMGIVGEAMRASVPIVLYPRRGATTSSHPANDQTEFARTIGTRHGLPVCEDARQLPALVAAILRQPTRRTYEIGSDVPQILTSWLGSHRGRTC